MKERMTESRQRLGFKPTRETASPLAASVAETIRARRDSANETSGSQSEAPSPVPQPEPADSIM